MDDENGKLPEVLFLDYDYGFQRVHHADIRRIEADFARYCVCIRAVKVRSKLTRICMDELDEVYLIKYF